MARRWVLTLLVTSIGPIPFATMVNREWGNTGQNYLRSLLALGFQAFLIMICVSIYAVLVQGIKRRRHLRRYLGVHGVHGAAVLRAVQNRQPRKIIIWGALTSCKS